MDWSSRIGRRLKLRDLHILFAVVQSGNMSKAARSLAVSNPVVSKAVGDLEHTLGVKLLDRTPLGVEPTIYGRALLDRSRVAFDELRQAVRDIDFHADPGGGEVRISASIAVATTFGAAVIDRLSRQYPRMTIQIIAGEPSATYRALEERRVDLGIVRLYAPFTEGHMNAEILYEEPWVIVTSAKNPWARRRKVTLAELMDEPWALPPADSLTGAVVLQAFRAHGLDYPRATVITNTLPARRAMLAGRRFLSVAPAFALRFPVSDPAMKALPIDLPMTRGSIGIVTLRNRTLSPVAQLFIEAAREAAKALRKAQGRSALPGKGVAADAAVMVGRSAAASSPHPSREAHAPARRP
jgi:DNA-binding transcriptional LysR family regulator